MLTDTKTKEFVTSFFYECFNFWTREGKDVAEAKMLAFRDCENLKHDPYAPCGEELNLEAKKAALNNLKKFELRE